MQMYILIVYVVQHEELFFFFFQIFFNVLNIKRLN